MAEAAEPVEGKSPASAAGTDIDKSIAGCGAGGLDVLSSAGVPAAVAEPAASLVGGGSAPSWGTGERENTAAELTHTLHGGKEQGVEVAPPVHALARQKKAALAALWAKPRPPPAQ